MDLGSHALTHREIICKWTKREREVDACCLVETNANWKNNTTKEKYKQLLTTSWTQHISVTSETKIKWSSLYKPGGTNTIIKNQLVPTIFQYAEDSHQIGR